MTNFAAVTMTTAALMLGAVPVQAASPTLPDTMIGNWCYEENMEAKEVGTPQINTREGRDGCKESTSKFRVRSSEYVSPGKYHCQVTRVEQLTRFAWIVQARCESDTKWVDTRLFLKYKHKDQLEIASNIVQKTCQGTLVDWQEEGNLGDCSFYDENERRTITPVCYGDRCQVKVIGYQASDMTIAVKAIVDESKPVARRQQRQNRRPVRTVRRHYYQPNPGAAMGAAIMGAILHRALR